MKANELRVGDLVDDYQFKKPVRVTIGVLEEMENGMNFYQPIPLTEEWLLRFGFEKIKSSDFGDFEYHKFISGSEYLVWFTDYSMSIGGSKEETDKGLCYCSNCIFQHVHQLQNLYYALTGKELKLKDK